MKELFEGWRKSLTEEEGPPETPTEEEHVHVALQGLYDAWKPETDEGRLYKDQLGGLIDWGQSTDPAPSDYEKSRRDKYDEEEARARREGPSTPMTPEESAALWDDDDDTFALKEYDSEKIDPQAGTVDVNLDATALEGQLDKLIDKIEDLDISMDYLAAAITGEDPLDIGVSQDIGGKLVNPHPKRPGAPNGDKP